tara:strand:- start:90 stop:473 length:384 start_codon:yes stop_codon:yes gene_type:complete
MNHKRVESRGRPSEKQVEAPRQYTQVYYDCPSKPELGGKITWYYDLDKFDKGPYLVEIYDPEYDKLEKLFEKLERLKTPKYHENGRKKRTTKIDKIKMETTEAAYWKEHYRLYPEDKPKKRGRRKKI